MDKSQDLLSDIARIEKEIEDLLEYRSELFMGGPALTGWAAFVAGFKRRMASRQALRHLQYLRLEREIANNSYETYLSKASRRNSAGRGPA
ncbi:MAG: hypothetical protein WA990_15245 [Rubrobacteraceae bacterium]